MVNFMEETTITYQDATRGKRVIEFAVQYRKPLGFYVVCSSDEDKVVFGSYSYDDYGLLLENFERMLSDLALLVESMKKSIMRQEEGPGTVIYTCGYQKNG